MYLTIQLSAQPFILPPFTDLIVFMFTYLHIRPATGPSTHQSMTLFHCDFKLVFPNSDVHFIKSFWKLSSFLVYLWSIFSPNPHQGFIYIGRLPDSIYLRLFPTRDTVTGDKSIGITRTLCFCDSLISLIIWKFQQISYSYLLLPIFIQHLQIQINKSV